MNENIKLDYQDLWEQLIVQVEKNIESRNDLKQKYADLKIEKEELEKELSKFKQREVRLESDIRQEFYKNYDEYLKRYITEKVYYGVKSTDYLMKKCDLCDAERMLRAIYPDGTSTMKICSCSKKKSKYSVRKLILHEIIFLHQINIDKTYSVKLLAKYKDGQKIVSFGSNYLFSRFSDEVKYVHEYSTDDLDIVFLSEEECQNYCDWVNETEIPRYRQCE